MPTAHSLYFCAEHRGMNCSRVRREEWQFGAREDWRYSDLAKQYGRAWPILSFFATYLVSKLS